MKPSRDMAMSLRAQTGLVGRGTEKIWTGELRRGISMVVPGDCDVHFAPGKVNERCACQYVEPQARFGGKDTPGFP